MMVDPDANYSRFYATESDKMSCKNYPLHNSAEGEMVELSKKRRKEDDNNCYDEEENDPAYVLFLSCLKGHGMSYILEGEQKGLAVSIKYEVDSGSDEVCDLESRRLLRSAMKQHKDSGSDEVRDLDHGRTLRSAKKQHKDSGSDKVCALQPRRTLRSATKRNKNSGSDEVSDLERRRTSRSATKRNKNSGSDKVCDLGRRQTFRSAMKQNEDSGSDKVCALQPRRTLRSATKRNKNSGSDEVSDLERRRTSRSAMEQNKDSGSDEMCDLQPRRTLRSATKRHKNSGCDQVCDLQTKSATKRNKNLGSDEVCDLEPRRTLRSATKQNKNSGSNEVCDLEPSRTSRSATKQIKNSGSDEVCDLEPSRILRSATKQIKKSGSDEECDLEPRRIRKSAMKKNKEPLDKKPLENRKTIKMVNGRQPRSKCKSEKKRKVRSSKRTMEADPDYLIFWRNLKVYNDDFLVYDNGNHKVVYSMTVGKNGCVKEEEDNDGSFSGVTFLGCSLPEEENLNLSTVNKTLDIMDFASRCDHEFRQKVIAVLRKPYDEEEYDRLWQDVGRRKTIGGRHLDLRKGRERPCSLTIEGKSYLDHYPGLEIKLLQVQNDKPKCLNLLRAFFCWLKLPGPFCPWEDDECLAIISESSKDLSSSLLSLTWNSS